MKILILTQFQISKHRKLIIIRLGNTTKKETKIKEQPKVEQNKQVKETIQPLTNNKSKDLNAVPVQSVPIPEYENINGEHTEEELNKYYALIESSTVTLNKKGVPTDYLEGTFCNNKNEMVKAIINPVYADELSKCDLGSQFILELKKFGERLFVEDCKYIFKQLKTEVA